MNHCLLLLLFIAFPAALSAQVCGFSEGKNLAQLSQAVFEKASQTAFSHSNLGQIAFQPKQSASLPPLVLMPKWSVEELPFFCRIEHVWGKQAKLPLKFRLGSVEYVDWLEGK